LEGTDYPANGEVLPVRSRPMAIESIELPVGSFTFQALAAGPPDGPVVLLLHGFPESSAEWRHQLDSLAAAGYRAVAPDQRGYSPGARPSGVDAYSIDHLVADIIAIADELGARRFHLVGHDWGAIVSWHVAAAYPDRLRSLTILSVPHPNAFARALAPDGGTDQPERSSYIHGFKQPGGGDFFVAGEGDGLRHAFAASGLAGHDVEDHVRVLTQPGAIDAAVSWYGAYDFHCGGIAAIEVPTLYVWSTDDPAIGRDGAEWTAECVRGPYRFEIFEGVPHWIPEAAPDRLDPLLLDHLAANS